MSKNDTDMTMILTIPIPKCFDAAELEVAMRWIERKLQASPSPREEIGGQRAYHILQVIHQRYMSAIGHPERAKPYLPE
jgi:hypothetical protein